MSVAKRLTVLLGVPLLTLGIFATLSIVWVWLLNGEEQQGRA